jgi:primosomal protein N' (replication factor Y)
MFAEVVVNRPTHYQPPVGSDPLREDDSRAATYTYRLPDRLREAAAVGHLVQVPLRTGTALGVIVALVDAPPFDLPSDSIRDIAEILDPLPAITPMQIELVHWIAGEYLVPLNQSIRLMLPPGLEERTTIVVSQTTAGPTSQGTVPGQDLTPEEVAVVEALTAHRGRLRQSSLLKKIPSDDPEGVIDSLADKGVVDARFALVPPKPAPPRVQYIRLLADEASIKASLPRLGHPSKQADVLLVLARRSDAPLTLAEVCELAECTHGPVRALAERGWVEITDRRTLVVAAPGAEAVDLGQAYQQKSVLSTLLKHGGPLGTEEILGETGASPAVLTTLAKKGLIQRISEEPVVLLKLSPDRVMDRIVELRGGGMQRAVLNALRGATGRVWVGGIYAQTGADLPTLKQLADLGLVSLHAEQYDQPRLEGSETPPRLTADQEVVWREIKAGMQRSAVEAEPFVVLLHGVTGSGKTEIYLRALEATLAAGQRAIVLVPEISLTAQTIRRFEARFPGRVALLHSQLSLGQRYAVWDRVRRGEADVVVGPRSALFAPISRLGLVVLDEVHDDSFKQAEPIPLPAYDARWVALVAGRLNGATIIMGSATPDLVTYYRAAQGTWRLLELPRRILPGAARAGQQATSPLPPVRIVDLRQELRAGNRSIFSRALQEALRKTLVAGEQAILFLNRRGAATFVLCRDCGYVARCPNCDVPLTLHRRVYPSKTEDREPEKSQRLICHHCRHRQASPSRCPNCGGRRIRHFGLGTERVEEAVHELCPEARLLRWDKDTATGPNHERFLQTFVDHRADVLIGTQMIAKGLDLPLVTLVGVVSADTALHLPDYRAAERTFQLLTQVAGRAGRSFRGGRVIVQTYNPDHYAIQAAAQHDYATFYRRELAYRRQLGYPPFSRMVALRYSDQDAHLCRIEAERLARWLLAEIKRTGLTADLIGPAPCFFSRVQGRYRWQIVIRARDPMTLLRDVALPRGWRVDVDPVSLL